MKYSYLLTCSVIALTCSQYAVASPLDNTSHTHTQHTLELKPISNLDNAFQTAATVFLPDKGGDYGFNGRDLGRPQDSTPVLDTCPGFGLTSCPANAKCTKCSTGNKYKMSGCNDGFKLSSGACIAKSCSEISPSYRADVPANQVCSTVSTYGKTCYQSCAAINFSGYPITSCPANTSCVDHPDCATTAAKAGNCSPVKKKVSTCTLPSQKLNTNASGCINKDDTCPTTYFKSCETGTVGTAKYTELGTACYQCKPVTPTVNIGDILYSDGTTSTEIIASKTPIGIVFDKDRTLAAALDNLRLYPLFNGFSLTQFDITGLPYYANMENAMQDVNGRDNTNKILSFAEKSGGTERFAQGAYFANSYSTAGTKSKDWYLPAAGEILSLRYNLDKLNEVLQKLGKGEYLPGQFQGSTEKDIYSMWGISGGSGGNSHLFADGERVDRYIIGVSKDFPNTTVPVINYTKTNFGNHPRAGDILYSDLTTSDKIISGKTPIGIVFDSEKKQAIALDYSRDEIMWGNTNMMGILGIGTEVSPFLERLSKSDGKEDTIKFLAYFDYFNDYCKNLDFNECKDADYPVINHISSFKTTGTKSGDWHIPSIAELFKIFIHGNEIYNTAKKFNPSVKTLYSDILFGTSAKNSTLLFESSKTPNFSEFSGNSRVLIPVINYGDSYPTDCSTNNYNYKNIIKTLQSTIRTSTCKEYNSWNSGILPKKEGDTCEVAIDRIAIEIYAHNRRCFQHKVDFSINSQYRYNICNSCCSDASSPQGLHICRNES